MSAQWELKNCSALTHPTPSSWVVILFLPGMKNCQSRKAPGSRLLPFPVISSVSDIRFYRFSLTFPRQPDYWSSGSRTHCMLGSSRCHFHMNRDYVQLRNSKAWIFNFFSVHWVKMDMYTKTILPAFPDTIFGRILSHGWPSGTPALWNHLLFQLVYNLLNQFSH